MFGHITNKCQNETKCPHCAGTHKHAQCNNKSNKKVQTAMGVMVLHIRPAQSIISTPTKSITLTIRESKPTKLKRQLLT